jgi:hypothetical protein
LSWHLICSAARNTYLGKENFCTTAQQKQSIIDLAKRKIMINIANCRILLLTLCDFSNRNWFALCPQISLRWIYEQGTRAWSDSTAQVDHSTEPPVSWRYLQCWYLGCWCSWNIAVISIYLQWAKRNWTTECLIHLKQVAYLLLDNNNMPFNPKQLDRLIFWSHTSFFLKVLILLFIICEP